MSDDDWVPADDTEVAAVLDVLAVASDGFAATVTVGPVWPSRWALWRCPLVPQPWLDAAPADAPPHLIESVHVIEPPPCSDVPAWMARWVAYWRRTSAECGVMAVRQDGQVMRVVLARQPMCRHDGIGLTVAVRPPVERVPDADLVTLLWGDAPAGVA